MTATGSGVCCSSRSMMSGRSGRPTNFGGGGGGAGGGGGGGGGAATGAAARPQRRRLHGATMKKTTRKRRDATTTTTRAFFEKTALASPVSSAVELRGLAFSSRAEDVDPAQAAALMGHANDAAVIAKLRAVFDSPEGCVIGAFARIDNEDDDDGKGVSTHSFVHYFTGASARLPGLHNRGIHDGSYGHTMVARGSKRSS